YSPTSATDTSRLSLPDALPISTKLGVGHGGFEVGDERGAVENEDWVAALARLDGGAHATLESSRVAHGHRSDYALEVFGTEGSADRKSTRLNSSHVKISYAVFC